LQELLQLSLDLTVLQRSVVRLPLDGFSNTDDLAFASFALPELLPGGEYPAVLTVNSSPVPLAATFVETPESEPHTRTSDLFNATDSARAAPLLQPSQEHTFLISVRLPSVRLSPPQVNLLTALCASEDSGSDLGSCEDIGDHTERPLLLELSGDLSYEAAVLLAVFPAGLPDSEVVAAASAFDEEWFDSSASAGGVVALPLPSTADEPVALQWVRWNTEAPRARVMLLSTAGAAPAGAEEHYVLRIVDSVGAVPDAVAQSALLTTAEPPPVPEFAVRGQQVLWRGSALEYHGARHPACCRPSSTRRCTLQATSRPQ
jgi:hypothetical protein